MTDRTPLRAFFAGADPTSIGEMQAGDTALVPSLKSAGAVQMGADATATRNFTWTPDGAGGLTLARGVMGATTQDILKVDVNGRITALDGSTAQTGDFKQSMRTSARPGWILADGNTIGNVGSGATNRANADCFDLFVAWWAEYPDAVLPIYNGTTLTTRGASALADWNAGRRLTVFDGRDRVPRMVGTIQGNGAKLEATEVMIPYGANSGALGIFASDQVYNYKNQDGAGAIASNYSQFNMSLVGPANLPTGKVRGASIGMPGYFKL